MLDSLLECDRVAVLHRSDRHILRRILLKGLCNDSDVSERDRSEYEFGDFEQHIVRRSTVSNKMKNTIFSLTL